MGDLDITFRKLLRKLPRPILQLAFPRSSRFRVEPRRQRRTPDAPTAFVPALLSPGARSALC